MLIDGRLRNEVHLIEDVHSVNIYNRYTTKNRDIYTNIDLQLLEDSIKNYNNIKYEYYRTISFYKGWTSYELDELISDTEKKYIIKLKQQINEIENEWSEKADAFLVWRRRKHAIVMRYNN
jgi:hypothetical protein